MDAREEIWQLVDARRAEFVALSDRIWDMPELAYTEFRSSAEHVAMLERQAFRITKGIAGIPTAVMGEAGRGGRVVAILGEYDALPGLSQQAGVAEPRLVEGTGNGHGCGHNLLGSGSLLAATAVKDYLAAHGLPGRVRYYGCPAEEGGAAKGFMVRAGAFDDVDVAVSWHPACFSGVSEAESLANTRIDFSFTGRAAHAAGAPHLGRSALDAVELMNVGVNYMREHMPDRARVHYALLDAGGIAPNVVQAHAKVRYLIRAVDLPSLAPLVERVRKIAQGAALMTETTVETRVVSAVSNLIGNDPLERLMQDNFEALGPPAFEEEDQEIAAMFQATLRAEDIAQAYARPGIPVAEGKVLCDQIVPLEKTGTGGAGSTDVGDVSWVVPTVQARGATCAIGTPFHSWQLTGQGKTGAAHEGMVHTAKVMAGTALGVLLDGSVIEKARDDLRRRTGASYVSPLPSGVEPALDMSTAQD
ncbi:MAG TPA: M20 family metallopeptidase [Candidatus Dormibacteraeota bacterium]|jgi:aminobenzoyl-glutamate utilization protein B|nr:M20 family metallopeptidase [Candidatus Dormibacteraeota bacterium]